ncbi:hypothetical protein DFH29DRAFT_1002821 [Suillus ampliporus]|nr:hypothetical protein DFH29DRAFT_1002821 [Suillus ampliporus]
MPLSLFSASDQPHPLHALIEPLLPSLRAAITTSSPRSLLMAAVQSAANTSTEKTVILEDKWRPGWLGRMEQYEVQIQILLYFVKLSLPESALCAPLPPTVSHKYFLPQKSRHVSAVLDTL